MLRLIHNRENDIIRVVALTSAIGVVANPTEGTEKTAPRWRNATSPDTGNESVLRAANGGNAPS